MFNWGGVGPQSDVCILQLGKLGRAATLTKIPKYSQLYYNRKLYFKVIFTS
jgi:hypothetical protein